MRTGVAGVLEFPPCVSGSLSLRQSRTWTSWAATAVRAQHLRKLLFSCVDFHHALPAPTDKAAGPPVLVLPAGMPLTIDRREYRRRQMMTPRIRAGP